MKKGYVENSGILGQIIPHRKNAGTLGMVEPFKRGYTQFDSPHMFSG